MIPAQTASLLHRQLGRVPSLLELFAALGLPNGEHPGDVAQDEGLTSLLRNEESLQSSLVRMLLFGPGDGPRPFIGPPQGNPSPGPGHALPHRVMP